MGVSRRQFLRGAAVSAASLAATASLSCDRPELVSRGDSGIEHIIVVMMENRSFDHMLGWLPGANGTQAGVSFTDNAGEAHLTYHLTTFTGVAHPDPDHTYAGGRSEYNGGKMDGWLRTTTNDAFCIGYYEEADLPVLSALARNFTTLDNYFSSILAPTYPNRIFQHAGQTDRLSNTQAVSTLPTIWDSLAKAGVSHTYYFGNVPFLAVWGDKYTGISRFYTDFLADCAAGSLPAVCFVDPSYTLLDDGDGNDDHPHADLRAGDAFLSQVYNAVTNGPGWKNTVLIINRDEWGGFYDTVAPPRVTAANNVDTDLVDGKALLGHRVPALVVSPFSMGKPAAPRIDSNLYDHTSVLKLIEWRHGLAPLGLRDASDDVASLALALDFGAEYVAPPSIPVVAAPRPSATGLFELGSTIDNESYDFYKLLKSDLTNNWPLPDKAMKVKAS
ncbi:MAG TPA: alkaline phosphatase family protein [Bryocella sp.]|nr:alkaline phosphatase family protein [Bryocella sp.]